MGASVRLLGWWAYLEGEVEVEEWVSRLRFLLGGVEAHVEGGVEVPVEKEEEEKEEVMVVVVERGGLGGRRRRVRGQGLRALLVLGLMRFVGERRRRCCRCLHRAGVHVLLQFAR